MYKSGEGDRRVSKSEEKRKKKEVRIGEAKK